MQSNCGSTGTSARYVLTGDGGATDDGRGGTKACNTSGTASDDGWPEHTFNGEIGQQLRAILEDAGATVLMSRDDDATRADCIDERMHKENASAADVVVSLHADGSGPGNAGFHISAITDPLPQNLADESSRLASTVRDANELAALRSPEGRQQRAQAVAEGLAAFLG